jgi:O-antigen/teichoic acid export membrane protein
LLLVVLPFFPDYSNLHVLLILFGASSFLQAANLKWSLLAHQKMTATGLGLMLMQVIFAAMVFGFVRGPDDVIYVPVWRVIAELFMVLYFAYQFSKEFGGYPRNYTLSNFMIILGPASIIGASFFLALMSFNFDSVLLGFLMGPAAVGWYSAAYKPVTVALAMPVTFFIGIFPVLSREFARDPGAFESVMTRAFRITSLVAFPFGVGGTLLAAPLIEFFFGAEYSNSIPVLQILAWSAVVVILRGTFKQGLIAADQHRLDLRCALIATACNVSLNFLLIPRYGITGAAVATVIAETIWLILASYYFKSRVRPIHAAHFLLRPFLAAIVMGAFLIAAEPLFWMIRALLSCLIYVALLALFERRL